MKVETQTFIPMELDKYVNSDPELSKLMREKGSTICLDWPSSAFTKLMNLSKIRYLKVCPRFSVVDNADDVLWYAMEKDSFCIINDRDVKWGKMQWSNLPYLEGTKFVKQFNEYRISKLRYVSNKVTCYRSCYFFPFDVVEILDNSNFTGFSWGEISNIKGNKVHEKFKLLVPELMHGTADISYGIKIEEGYPIFPNRDYYLPQAGIRCYPRPSLSDANDFNLSLEPMSGYNEGTVIVSKRARDLFVSHKIKGVFFLPVLITDTPIYQNFVKTWLEFEAEIMAANPENQIQ